jgi:hypothetical protein
MGMVKSQTGTPVMVGGGSDGGADETSPFRVAEMGSINGIKQLSAGVICAGNFDNDSLVCHWGDESHRFQGGTVRGLQGHISDHCIIVSGRKQNDR